jgi:YesN/AraC family two-component response regulator
MPDLVITDLIMGGVDGIQVSKSVKEMNPSSKIIILTGFPSTLSAIEALKLGTCDYLLKPCEKNELFKSVEDCLSSKSNMASIAEDGEIRGGPVLLDRFAAKLSYRLIDVTPLSYCYQGHASDKFSRYCKPRRVRLARARFLVNCAQAHDPHQMIINRSLIPGPNSWDHL